MKRIPKVPKIEQFSGIVKERSITFHNSWIQENTSSVFYLFGKLISIVIQFFQQRDYLTYFAILSKKQLENYIGEVILFKFSRVVISIVTEVIILIFIEVILSVTSSPDSSSPLLQRAIWRVVLFCFHQLQLWIEDPPPWQPWVDHKSKLFES